jgi:carboxymethylenebutenolidase
MQMNPNEFTGTVEVLRISREGGTLPMYYAAPPNATDRTPSVVIAMHVWGVDESMRAAARRFAQAGFAAAVPDLYAGFDAPNGDGATDHAPFAALAKRLTFDVVDPDFRAAAALLRERLAQTRTAIAGFCMGGTMALRRSYGYAGVFDAAAVWYGKVDDVDPKLVEVPLVGSFGADDAGIPAESVEAFRDALHAPNDVVVYPNAGHAFCDRQRARYAPTAAEDSWKRTIGFLREYL